MADLHVLEARALASLGKENAEAAAQAVVRAENAFQHVVPENEPEWARFIDPAYLFGEAAHCFRDLDDTEQIARFGGESAAEATRQKRARRGALSQAALAIGELTRDAEAAATRGLEVITLTRSVSSSRCIATVRDLTVRFRPYEHLEQVQRFQAEAHELLCAAA
jgi:hypothetical protein